MTGPDFPFLFFCLIFVTAYPSARACSWTASFSLFLTIRCGRVDPDYSGVELLGGHSAILECRALALKCRALL